MEAVSGLGDDDWEKTKGKATPSNERCAEPLELSTEKAKMPLHSAPQKADHRRKYIDYIYFISSNFVKLWRPWYVVINLSKRSPLTSPPVGVE